MALFQNENNPATGVNYKSMGKDQLIMLLNSQKSDIDALSRKLSEAAGAVEERNSLRQHTEALRAENEALRAKAAALEEKLSAQENNITEVGSIAEMSVRVSGVMEAAQRAADNYLAKIKEMHDVMSREYSEYEINARKKADEILTNAKEKANSITENARKESNEIWGALQSRFDNYVADKKQ